MRDFIERLRAKPEHVRRRIAFGTTAGITGIVTFGWILAVVVSGNLALAVPVPADENGTIAQAPSDAPSGSAIGSAFDQTKSGFTQLLGAVGVTTATTAPAALQTVDRAPAAKPVHQSGTTDINGATVIPF